MLKWLRNEPLLGEQKMLRSDVERNTTKVSKMHLRMFYLSNRSVVSYRVLHFESTSLSGGGDSSQ